MLRPQSTISASRVTLRTVSLNDAPALHEMLTNDYLCDKAGLQVHTHINQTKDFILEGNFEHNQLQQYFYGIYLEDKLIGLINLFNLNYQDKNGEYGYFIHPDYTRHGYMRESIIALSNYVFENTKLKSINVYVDTDNKASLHLAKNLKLTMKEASIQEDLQDRAIEMVRFVINKQISQE